jgi:hypothetical protein
LSLSIEKLVGFLTKENCHKWGSGVPRIENPDAAAPEETNRVSLAAADHDGTVTAAAKDDKLEREGWGG